MNIIAKNLQEWCCRDGTYVDYEYLEKMAWGELSEANEYKDLDKKYQRSIISILNTEATNDYHAKGKGCN